MTSKQRKQPRPRIELFPVPMLSIHNSSNRDSDSNGSEFDPIINRSSSPASIPEPIASQHRQAQAKERQFERQLATRQQRGLGADIGNTLASNSMGGRDTKVCGENQVETLLVLSCCASIVQTCKLQFETTP